MREKVRWPVERWVPGLARYPAVMSGPEPLSARRPVLLQALRSRKTSMDATDTIVTAIAIGTGIAERP